MNISDEELQKQIEAGLNIERDHVDARAYREVFSALSTEPKIRISQNFADRVAARVEEKGHKSEARDYFWFGVGLFFLLITFVVALVMTAPKLHLGFLKDMSGYAGLFIFGVGILVALNWLDKRMINKTSES
jgi:hypothetical protein